MSLDVYLMVPNERVRRGGSGIFIRENGSTKEITRAEWDEKFPDREPVVMTRDGDEDDGTECVFDANITHNLGAMASKVSEDFYKALWRPEELFENPKASDIAAIVREGYNRLAADPEHYKQFDAPNGWGTYRDFLPWVGEYATALEEAPDALVRASR